MDQIISYYKIANKEIFKFEQEKCNKIVVYLTDGTQDIWHLGHILWHKDF